MRMLVLVFGLVLAVSASSTFSCEGRKQGYYCFDKNSYGWCYGQANPSVSSCPSGTECLCGYTSLNPCGWPGTTLSDCSGKPGDFGGADTEDEPETDEKPDTSVPETTDKKFVAYFDNWSQYHTSSLDGRSCRYMPENVDASHLTHLHYGFAVFNEQFQVTTYEWNDEDLYARIQSLKTKYPKLKTLLAIGGWNFNFFESTKHLFTTMAASAANRKTFINSAIAFARRYGFDGIDIDWEYPGIAEQGGRPQDKENFSKLLKEFREAINNEGRADKLLLAIAAPAGFDKIEQMEIDVIHKYLDYMTIMLYDFHGAFDGVTGAHTAFYPADDRYTWMDALAQYDDAGVPRSKILPGFAIYGRTWTLEDRNCHKFGCKSSKAGDAEVCTQEAGFLNSYEIVHVLGTGGTSVYDNATGTQYGYAGDQFVSYDTDATYKLKTDYVCQKGYGGAMAFSLSMDTDHRYINSIADAVFNCQSEAPDVCDRTKCDDELLDCLESSKVSQACTCVDGWYDCLESNGC